MMNKKGVSLSFNVIIIAILGLLVLAILVFMISRTANDTVTGTLCSRAGGTCVDSGTCDNGFPARCDAECQASCNPGDCCSLMPKFQDR